MRFVSLVVLAVVLVSAMFLFGCDGPTPPTNESISTGILAGSVSYTGTFPTPQKVSYTSRTGASLSAKDAYPGFVNVYTGLYVQYEDPGTVEKTINSNGGIIASSIPVAGMYLVKVQQGKEAAFISAMYKQEWVLDAAPASSVPIRATVSVYDFFGDPKDGLDCHDDHGDIAKLIAGRHSKSTEAVELETLPHKGDRVENLDIAKSMIQRTETAAAKGENVVFSLSIQSAEQEDVAGSDDRTGCTIQECKDARRGQELLYRTFLQAFEAELELNPSVGEHAIIVIAAGNAGVDLDKEIEQLQYDYPMAAYNMVIVGGTDAPGSIEMTQNHKADNTWPDMVYSLGVGVNVTSGSKTASCTGTSFATPEVSGILDYIWSQAPSLNASQVMSAFQLTMMIMAENNTLPQDAAGHTDQAFLDEAVKNAKDMLPTPFIPGGNVTNGTSKNESGGWDLGVPDPLPDATATEPYLREVNIEGGTPPYTFSLDSSADFYGTGITMSYENGTISGTPPYTAAGTYHLTICVRDSSGEQEHCANTTLTINPPKYETWSGHVKTSRYECEDIIHGGWSGRIDGEFEFTITVQGDLYRVLNGELSEDIINPWWGLDQSGTWSGTDTVGMACGKSDYRVVGGSVNIPIEVKANNNQSTISGYPVIMFEGKGAMDMDDEPALLPGGWQDIDGSGGIGGTWSSLNFVVLVMSDGFMSGNVSLNENDMGTFTMAKGFGK